VYLLAAQPATLDPGLSADLWEGPVIHAMFEGLTSSDPATGQAVAAIATHYDVSADQTEYVLYLRGHRSPRGIALRGSHRKQGPARWSDGRPITAHDFVYAWRRVTDPATAAPSAYLFQYLAHGEAVISGERPPEALGVGALDDFSLQVRLETPIPFLLRMLANRFFYATPRQAIDAARRRGAESSWTLPANIVTSGPFHLREHRAYEKIVLARNPAYHAEPACLEEIEFQIVPDGPVSANLYRTGDAAFTMPMSPLVVGALKSKKDLHKYPSCGAYFPAMNTRMPPFDDVRVRYAFNMAIDKRALASFLGDGRTSLSGVVPPMPGYASPDRLMVDIGGVPVDVLSFNPRAARALREKAGFRALATEYLFPDMPEFGLVAEILQQQWRDHLGIEVRLVRQETQTWGQAVFNVAYRGIAAWGEVGGIADPTWFLDIFKSPTGSGSGWSDPHYNSLLVNAKRETDPAERMRRLADCERELLRSMPCLPLYDDVWAYLCKPFVKGIAGDPFHGRVFNDAWIDTHWRVS
jgi:oligopeptide transport system substrate-binding protein